jgi:hypothetical protein
MQWWGSLSQQFQQIASSAIQEAAAQTALEAGRNVAAGLAREAVSRATEAAADMTRGVVNAVGAGASKTIAKKPLPKSAEAKKSSYSTAPASRAVRAVKPRPAAPSTAKTVAKATAKPVARVAAKAAAKAPAKTPAKAPAKASKAAPRSR